MTIQEIREALRDRRLPVVAEATGLSYLTVYKASRGANVSYKTAEALSKYLRGDRGNG